MKTITTKTSKSGAQLWYVDGKRTSRDNAIETSIANGRENLSNLLTGLTSDDNAQFAVYVEVNDELSKRYSAIFKFATADNAVKAARKIVALGTKQVHRVVIDNCKAYPSNIRYGDTTRGLRLKFFNGFERYDTDDNDIDGFDETAFDALPTVDELNDTRSDIEKMFDEFAAKYTDRDARFNHGERHAEKLTAKLREIDPTVEVTYDINEDDEDTFYLIFGKYVYRTPFATLRAVEEAFHLWSEGCEPNRNMKLAAKIVDSVNGTLQFLSEGVTKNGKPTVSFDVTDGSEISPMIRVTEAFTDGTKSAIDYVEVTRDY